MPLSYAFGDFEITGGLGNDPDFQSPAIAFQWKWYYSFPTLPLWITLLLMTFLPKRNRQDRIAPLLITPLVAEVLYQFLSWNITARDAVGIDAMIYLCVSLTMAWTAVWILAPWISRGNRLAMVGKQFTLMLLLGVISLGGYFGFSWPEISLEKMSSDKDQMLFALAIIGSVTSLVMVGAAFCIGLRRSPSKPFRPMLRILFVLPVVAFFGLCLFGVIVCLLNCGFTVNALTEFPGFLAFFWPAALVLAGFIYLLNVPICLMSYRWPQVKERWHASFPEKRKKRLVNNVTSVDVDDPCATQGGPKVD